MGRFAGCRMAPEFGVVLMSTTAEEDAQRNPGPDWGYGFLRLTDKIVPECIFRPVRALGTAIAMAGMPRQRRHSRDYLRLILGREPRLREIFRHFFAFEEALMLKLRIANGRHIPCKYKGDAEDFRAWLDGGGGQVLLGSMHVGVSDMLGFQIGGRGAHSVYMVRQKVANSHDTERLERRFGGRVKFIWVNDPKDMLFALKEAASTPHPIAMKCDRVEHSSRVESFDFLGKRRVFPFTIYYLALIFRRPVLMSVGVSGDDGVSELHATPLLELREGESREAFLVRARAHFQAFLHLIEGLLRRDPYVWFNFTELNPEPAEVTSDAARVKP